MKRVLAAMCIVLLISALVSTAFAESCTPWTWQWRIGATFCTTPTNCNGKGSQFMTWYENAQYKRICVTEGEPERVEWKVMQHKLGCC